MVVELLNAWSKKNAPVDESPNTIRKAILSQASSAFTKGYRSCGFEDPIIQPFCHHECPVYWSINKRRQEGLKEQENKEVSHETGD